MTHFSKVLIANRGEIACRVIKTAKNLGYQTVAVFSDADRNARHVLLADEAVYLGASPVGESYLHQDKILEAIDKSGADAVHPGYGFLSENEAFARALEDKGVVFIGPPASAIALMGSKRESKLAMIEAGVPCVPGYQGNEQDPAILIQEAIKVGLPVMLKASAGGGGRGMRLVQEKEALAEAIQTACSEARNAFGSDEMIIERAVMRPRHIEIQVFADSHGNCISLGERDCSVQRRHQKVIEEAPSPAVSPELRQEMGQAAVRAAQACNYVGAGTVEFLLDSSGEFYFLEMNTRLQVEHPVTEMVTGQDLVEWQLRVASGETLPLKQEEVESTGHAIEVRLYAEDPANGFLPQTGDLLRFEIPELDECRTDHGVVAGQQVTPFYDPMLAKLIAWGPDRETARRKLSRIVKDAQILGMTTNQGFLSQALDSEDFVKGEATTALIGDWFTAELRDSLGTLTPAQWLLAAALLKLEENPVDGQVKLPRGFRNSIAFPTQCQLSIGDRDESLELLLNQVPHGVQVQGTALGESVELTILRWDSKVCAYEVDGVTRSLGYLRVGPNIYLSAGQGSTYLQDTTLRPPQLADGAGSGKLKAPMDGAVVTITVKEGDAVTRGQTVAVIEAMKMEHPLKADVDGTIQAIHTELGSQVKGRQLLVEIQA